jgi:hypothetical protein
MLDGFQRWVLMQTAILLRRQLLYLELCLFSSSLAYKIVLFIKAF